jgi:GNAT superfamily N-acetyltransferase
MQGQGGKPNNNPIVNPFDQMTILAGSRGASDWAQARAICCASAAAGAPIAAERWPFFADLWVGPYERWAPELTYFLVAPDRSIQGYCTAATDTGRFDRYFRWVYSPRLALRLLLRRYPYNPDARRWLRQWVGLEPTASRLLGAEAMRAWVRQYPAHLHINLSSVLRGQGVGSRLMAEACRGLRERGVKGVHVICGESAVSFYRKSGFEELRSAQVPSGKRIYALGLKL